MKILGVDTTRKGAYIFLINNNEMLLDVLNEDEKQSENLMLHIDALLQKNNINLSDFDAFAVVTGPGSFTGIRVGIATIKAFAYALNKPIVSASLFDILCDDVKNGTIISECTSNSVYYCNVVNSKIIKMGVEELTNLDKFSNKNILKEEHLSQADAYNFNVLNNYPNLVFKKFLTMVKNNQFNNPEPFYLQLSQAERNLENKHD